MENIEIKSLAQYVEKTEALKVFWKERELWYRGVSDSQYKLIPSLYRGEFEIDAEEEYGIFNDFKLKAKFYVENSAYLKNIEWYSLMQHYGLPTRLLDWTTGSLIALYFSLRGTNAENERAVYIINPDEFNNKIHMTDELIASKDREKNTQAFISKYAPSIEIGDYPIGIIPPYIDKRIIAQKSRFTVHGKIKESIEDVCSKFELRFAKLTISKSFVYSLKMELVESGITESVLFPDLEGLAREFIFNYVLD